MGENSQLDTMPTTQDTLKKYFVTYDILVENNLEISHIEVQIKSNPQPLFYTFEIINHVDDSVVYRYKQTFDVGWMMETMNKNDTAFFRYATAYPGSILIYSPTTDTLIK
jgi:hypothetical protein